MMEIHPTSQEDLPMLAEIEARIAPHPWSAAMFLEELRLGSLCLTGRVAGRVMGYGVARPMGEAWDLLLMGVDRPFQRQGHGRALVQALVQGAKSGGATGLVLEVRAGNLAARGLYRGEGFQQVGVRRGYYPPPHAEDGVVMALTWGD